ncbi:MAG: hypothetical protein NTV16_08135 [Actinobacteria bacterium]|nr:hypothetical protein [Actinomycetota bacterium]
MGNGSQKEKRRNKREENKAICTGNPNPINISVKDASITPGVSARRVKIGKTVPIVKPKTKRARFGRNPKTKKEK